MIKVKLVFPYDWPLLRQTQNLTGKWGDYNFYLEDTEDEYDALVVFNFSTKAKDKTICFKNKTIFIATEPYEVQQYYKKYINQFAHVISSQQQISHSNKIIYHTGAPWFVNKDYNELIKTSSVEKKKKISIITSDKLITKGHKQRFDFAMKIKEYFQDEIDLFGRGICDFEDKWDVLAPYKYNICIENGSHSDYFTEKINDCFLAFTFPIYSGCTNLDKYYNNNSFRQININNFDSSLRSIEKILNDEDHYDQNLKYIQEARIKCLNEYNIFPLLVNILDKIDVSRELKEEVIIKKEFFDLKTLLEKVDYKLNSKSWK
jgi:hypothetical protein